MYAWVDEDLQAHLRIITIKCLAVIAISTGMNINFEEWSALDKSTLSKVIQALQN